MHVGSVALFGKRLLDRSSRRLQRCFVECARRDGGRKQLHSAHQLAVRGDLSETVSGDQYIGRACSSRTHGAQRRIVVQPDTADSCNGGDIDTTIDKDTYGSTLIPACTHLAEHGMRQLEHHAGGCVCLQVHRSAEAASRHVNGRVGDAKRCRCADAATQSQGVRRAGRGPHHRCHSPSIVR
eukprot:4855538-Prymnesium_polylepis.1